MPSPVFEIYEVADVPFTKEEMWDPDVNLDEDVLEGVSPVMELTSWEAVEEVLDEGDEDEYVWLEVGVEAAPERTVCSTCGATVRTFSDERVEALRTMHHVSTGH